MVWKAKRGRRTGSRNTVYPNDSSTPGSRSLRSCLKVGPSDKLYVSQRGKLSTGESSLDRDLSGKGNGRSFLGVISGSVSSKSRDTVSSSGDHPRSAGSRCSSGDASHRSGENEAIKDPQHSPYFLGVSAEPKAVRFGTISIREHERTVGDNPSCSTGPPIGIGWRHADTQSFLIDEFEDRKGYRKTALVLTRGEREDLLLNWGISFDDIIDAIRTNIRVKNQRRQTVTNVGKAERFELALEGAARRIKRALLLRRSTAEKVRKLQEQAEVAAKAHVSSNDLDEHRPSKQQAAGISSEEECDQDRAMTKNVTLAGLQEAVPPHQIISTTGSMSDFDELQESLGGFSLGNSTTASAKEMEYFYRELEIEMFGDTSLPDMVGETLEVPGVIPEDERVYHDLPNTTIFAEPPSICPSQVAMNERGTEFDEKEIEVKLLGPISAEGSNILFHDDPLTAIRMGHTLPPNIRVTNGFDPLFEPGTTGQHLGDRARAYLSETVTAMEQRYLHPSLTPPLPSAGSPKHARDNDPSQEPSGDISGSPKSQSGGGSRSRRSKRRKDYPVVCHFSPMGKRTVTHWMEGWDDGCPFALDASRQEVVTITEDARCDFRIQPSSHAAPETEFGTRPPAFVAPPRFPVSSD